MGIWAVRIVKGDFVWYGTGLGFEEEFVEGADGDGDLPAGVGWHVVGVRIGVTERCGRISTG